MFAVAHEQELRDFASFLLVEGLGPRTLQSLALIAEVVHGAPSRFADPARFSFAHGGKDGHPFPVPLKTYDESLGVYCGGRSKLLASGHTEKLHGFKRLDQLSAIRREPAANRSPSLTPPWNKSGRHRPHSAGGPFSTISGNHDSMVSLSNDHCFELYEADTLAVSEGSGAGMQDSCHRQAESERRTRRFSGSVRIDFIARIPPKRWQRHSSRLHTPNPAFSFLGN